MPKTTKAIIWPLMTLGIKFIFPVFSNKILPIAKWLKLPKGKVLKKRFVVPIESWFFTSFQSFFFFFLHDVILNVAATI
jgi:hypothetical protein